MAATSRGSVRSLVERLQAEPQRFEFFQAVRLILLATQASQADARQDCTAIGTSIAPGGECLRFSSTLAMAFAGAEVASARAETRDDGLTVHSLTVSFLGLAGASGVLPSHYTRLILDRVRRGDDALRDFLDLFNHRLTSFFYRAWEKHRLAIGYERSIGRSSAREDMLTQCLYSLIGLGGNALSPTDRRSSVLRGRFSVPDETLLYFAPLLTHRPRTATVLSNLLSEFTGISIGIHQYQGQWLHLSPADQTNLPSAKNPNGMNCGLGTSAIIGSRIWTGESRFRLQTRPLTWSEFEILQPKTVGLRQVCELTALFTGTEYDFDIQPVLKAEAVPCAQLGGKSRLGWNAWTLGKPRTKDATEAIFKPEGMLAPSSKSVG
jgi:type VI secretion system protein ImpH